MDNEKWVATIRSAKSQQRINIWLTPAFLVGIGVLFLAFGIYREGISFNFATVMGAGFVTYGAIYAWRMHKWSKQQLQ